MPLNNTMDTSTPENEVLGNVREEKLSKMLLTEVINIFLLSFSRFLRVNINGNCLKTKKLRF